MVGGSLEAVKAADLAFLPGPRNGTVAAAAICIVFTGSCVAAPASVPDKINECHLNVYETRDGEIVNIARSEGTSLRWRQFDGTTGALTQLGNTDTWSSSYGWTGRSDGKSVRFSDCKHGWIDFDGAS